jgi:uncharacterized protein YkwD
VQGRVRRADTKGMARRVLVLACLAFLALASVSSAQAITVRDADKLERGIVARINTIRHNKGLRVLESRPGLKRGATAHVKNMANHGYFEHHWSDGTPYGRWIRRFWPGPGYRGWSAGENLYWEGPSTTARRVVAAWMHSPPHRRNMLNGSWRFLGVGAVRVTNPIGAYAGVDTAFLFAVEFGSRSK